LFIVSARSHLLRHPRERGDPGVHRELQEARRRFPPLDYESASAPAQDPWRWRAPPDGFDVKLSDRPEASSLILVLTIPSMKLSSALGYGLFVLLAADMVHVLMTRGWCADSWFMLILFLLPWALLNVNNYPVQIDFEPKEAAIVVRYGIFLHRIVRFRRKPGLHVTGKLESVWSLDPFQDAPYYIVSLEGEFWRCAKKFYLPYDERQGDWIAAGLRSWLAAV
jgi:hypothetical protein